MRLKKLTIQALGPFKNKKVIDFEKNNIDKGLLLITGDTGAGKTSIFDAICYALYGESSGESRKTNSLRSDFSSHDLDTFVELEFYHNNKLYTVKRSPEYMRPSKRGKGLTKKIATAEFEINGRIETKTSSVTKEIEELLGLDYKQFHQVSMLSQGEFTKFLLASSDEKTSIFRKIFNTDIYNNIMNKLKEELNLKSQKFEFIKSNIQIEKNKIEDLNYSSLTDSELVSKLKQQLHQKEEERSEIKKEKEKIYEKNQKKNTEYELQENINKKIIDLENTKEKLKELENNNKSINEDKKIYDYNVSIGRKIFLVKTEIENNEKLIHINKGKLSKVILTNKKLKDTFHSKKDEFLKIDKFEENYDFIMKSKNELNDKYRTYNSAKKIMNNIEKLKEKLNEEFKKYEVEANKYKEMEKFYYLNTAFVLAEQLEENKPCPVCGSKSHPKIASKSDTTINKEELDRQNKIVSKINDSKKEYEVQIDECRKQLSEFNLDKNIDIEKEMNETSLSLALLNEQQEKLSEEFKRLSEEKEELDQQIIKTNKEIELYTENILTHEKEKEVLKEKLNIIYKDNNTNEKEYESKKISDNELAKLNSKIKEYDNSKSEYTVKIEVLSKEVEDKKMIDLTEKKEELENMIQQYKLIDHKYNEMSTKISKQTDIVKNIEKYLNDYNTEINKYNTLKRLSDTANAKLVGKQKITFENYVQSYYLNSVLIEANKRLSKMTDGRYDLKRKEIGTSLQEKIGLEFSIFDSYTGKERDVSSLSGGEKFKAALSLALGLSDVISMYAGGIKMDCLFIDEGFGSLDQESLNQALNTLSDLVDDDKLVGVISHVSELISRIDHKIIVKKNNDGSNIEIES